MTEIKSISEAFKSINPGSEELDFLNKFDNASSIQDSISSGYTDFLYRILTPDLLKLIGKPSESECCEIGFGAGRLLLPASFIFKRAHGIDIHENFQKIEDRIKSFNRTNFILHKSENASKNIENNSIKFAFSFIVFQHFESWETAKFYFDLLHEKLQHGGCGIIFFGKNNINDQECFIPSHSTYEDFPMTLFVKESFVKNEISKKFDILEIGTTSKRPWLSEPSRQFYVKFRKV